MVRWQAGSVMGNGSSVTNGPLAAGVCGPLATHGPVEPTGSL